MFISKATSICAFYNFSASRKIVRGYLGKDQSLAAVAALLLTAWKHTEGNRQRDRKKYVGKYLNLIGMSYEIKKMVIFSATQEHFLQETISLAGRQINSIYVNFHLHFFLEIFDKNSADKIWSKRTRGWKVPSLMPIRVEHWSLDKWGVQ